MEQKEAINDILNDLLQINNDRIAGYERATNETKNLDIDLKAIFEQMIRQSKENKDELTKMITQNDGMIEDDTTSAGKIYGAWMNIKSTLTDSDRYSILEACEFGEDAAQRAYESALANNELTDGNARTLITEQQASLKKSHELIKQNRDAHLALKK